MLVIIHGWSDTHSSFRTLGRRLVSEGIADDVAHVRLGDYISLDDAVTFNDIAHALNAAWARASLPTQPRSVDVVVHSTGGLVIRHWMTEFFKPSTNPIRRLLMLAPANFGSPLAHKGRSFAGRIIKGFKSDKPFQTGTHILKGLELASPYSWELAQRDRFSSDVWYGPGRVLCTVLVGTSGYSGISAAANEAGTDGTVRVSTANLDPLLLRLDFAANPETPTRKLQAANGAIAFARVPHENHSTIALKENGPKNDVTMDFIRRALQITDAQFPQLIADLDAHSQKAREQGADKPFTQGYQNTVVRLSDNYGAFVKDFFLEVFSTRPGTDKVDDALTRKIQEDVLTKVHAYGDNSAYRSLLFNTTVLLEAVTRQRRSLSLSVTAEPDIRLTRSAGYRTFGYNDIGNADLTVSHQRSLFVPDRTVLIDLVIRREQMPEVFEMRPLK
ncbi:alpha/beta hydrolase [Sinimarinibacterium sp. CAU 1509]|uniref:esterase/lipase family protein n=1 Tax=Sinimarinibacterium sp. CAU 1509 TaxID=2562283 RepID=UPI0010AD826F|nr:alpha/beta hydrolase [Sinimarinibacterium sp. CAU 1509]TJY55918.1 alpha/beta hydrolase [Sinimarinibacterium sp. CAU 1509]